MSSRDILSQEEVDALLNFKDTSDETEDNTTGSGFELSAQDKDVIGEIGNISMGTAATALFTILNKKVEITAPVVSMTTFSQLVSEFDRPCILVEVEYISGVEGRNVLIIKQQDASIIADLMMGGDGLNPPQELDELHLSAVGEAMNQMMGSASTSLANIINRSVNISPPITELLTLNADVIKKRNFDPDDPVAKISFRMKIENLVDSHIMQLAPISFVKDLVSTLMGGETASTTETVEEDWMPEMETEEPKVADQSQPGPQQIQQQYPNSQQMPMGQPGYGQQPPYAQPWGYPQQYPQQQQANKSVEKAVFPEFGNAFEANALNSSISLIEDVPLQVSVQLGKTQMPIKDILELGSGSIIELDKLAGEPVDLFVNGKLVAKGEVVVIDENFGFRVKDIVSPLERLKQA